MQKSAIEEINELKARLESMAEQAKAEALDKASEAIGVLRELGQRLRNAPPSFPNDCRTGTRRCAYRSPVYGAQCVRAPFSLRTWDTVDG
jgi:hypothetical protein